MESARTIVVAGLANLAIAAAKAIMGLLSGSAAMLSEAAHSVADTTTEALAGLILATLGLGLTVTTGSSVWDGAASIGIGVLLIFVATTLVRANASLLVGRSVSPVVQRHVREELDSLPEIEKVEELFTSVIGMADVLVAARVKFTGAASAEAITAAADEAERRLSRRYPSIRYVFLDPKTSRRWPVFRLARTGLVVLFQLFWESA